MRDSPSTKGDEGRHVPSVLPLAPQTPPDALRYMPSGQLALMPEAYGAVYEATSAADESGSHGEVAIVSIQGPLNNHRSHYYDSYESIRERFSAAIESGASTIVLNIDSPGGLVSGCFDLAREMRRRADAEGVDLKAYISGYGASAAYALASAAHDIAVSESAMVGSIGVIVPLVDATKVAERFGVGVQLITSGKKKPYGHPLNASSDDETSTVQAQIDALGEVFASLVSEHGWGGSIQNVRSLEAGIFVGAAAVKVGLATRVASLEELVLTKPTPRSLALQGAAHTNEDNPHAGACAVLTGAAASEREETPMAEKRAAELDAMKAQLAQLEAEKAQAEAARANAEAATEKLKLKAKADRISGMLDKHGARGALAPAHRDFYTRAAAGETTPEDVEAHLGSLSAVLQDATVSGGEGLRPKRTTLSESEKAAADATGLSHGDYLSLINEEAGHGKG